MFGRNVDLSTNCQRSQMNFCSRGMGESFNTKTEWRPWTQEHGFVEQNEHNQTSLDPAVQTRINMGRLDERQCDQR